MSARLVAVLAVAALIVAACTATTDGDLDVLPQPVTIELHSDMANRSQLVLPVVEGFTAPTPRPACGSRRGQPCLP